MDNLPISALLAQEIVEGLEGALKQFREIPSDLDTEMTTEKMKVAER
jgi:hypothetical protein